MLKTMSLSSILTTTLWRLFSFEKSMSCGPNNRIRIWNYRQWLNKLIHLYSLHLFNPSARAGCDTWFNFQESLTSLNSAFYFFSIGCHINVKGLSLPYYLCLASERIVGCTHFPMVLMLCGMQITPSRIWTQVTMFIPYDDVHYTRGFFKKFCYNNSNKKAVLLLLLIVILIQLLIIIINYYRSVNSGSFGYDQGRNKWTY